MSIETITISPEMQIRILIAVLCLFTGFVIGKLHSLFNGCDCFFKDGE